MAFKPIEPHCALSLAIGRLQKRKRSAESSLQGSNDDMTYAISNDDMTYAVANEVEILLAVVDGDIAAYLDCQWPWSTRSCQSTVSCKLRLHLVCVCRVNLGTYRSSSITSKQMCSRNRYARILCDAQLHT